MCRHVTSLSIADKRLPLCLIQGLAQLEILCKQLYETTDTAVRHQAEKALVEFTNSPDCLSKCQLLLERGSVSAHGAAPAAWVQGRGTDTFLVRLKQSVKRCQCIPPILNRSMRAYWTHCLKCKGCQHVYFYYLFTEFLFRWREWTRTWVLFIYCRSVLDTFKGGMP